MPVMLPMKESSRCGGISDCITLYQETHLLQQLPAPSAGEHRPAGPPWGPPSCSKLCMALGACISLTSPLCRTVLLPRQRAHLHRHPVMCGHCQQHEPHHSAPWLPFCPAGPCCFKSMSDSPPLLPCEAWQLPSTTCSRSASHLPLSCPAGHGYCLSTTTWPYLTSCTRCSASATSCWGSIPSCRTQGA